MAYLALSRLAAYDLEELQNYSIERWGKQVADRYEGSIEQALQRLKDNPSLLKDCARISKDLRLYRVEKHFLVCVLVDQNVYVLTVKHGAMDLPERIGELEPVLRQEAEILHQAFLESRK